jgi:hypothetical protein
LRSTLPEESDAKPSAEEVVEVEATKISPQDSLQTFINNEISHSSCNNIRERDFDQRTGRSSSKS